MKLILGQAEAIKSQIEVLNTRLQDCKEIIRETIPDVKFGEFTDVVDSVAQEELYRIEYKKRELKGLLENLTIVNDCGSDTIQIGMTFSCITIFNNEAVEETYTLVETKEGLSGNYISVSSPLGENVVGKKINDLFEYEIDGNTIRGMITGIANIISSDIEEPEDIKFAKWNLKFLLSQKCSLSHLHPTIEKTLNMEIDKYFKILSENGNQKVKK